jgi:ATP-dependent Clp protease ATP-binding subunit ClpA
MFEKFTENAIKVIMHSREEARRLEFGFVQPEHLFLGILHDKVGISALVLNKLGLDLKKVRRVVERVTGRGYTIVPLEQVSFTMNVMEIITNSVALASRYPKEAVSSEHILLSLLGSKDENLQNMLNQLNLDKEEIETEIKVLWQDDENFSHDNGNNTLPEHYSPKFLTNQAALIMDDASAETIKQGHVFTGTEQILLSLSKEKFNNIAGKVLRKFGLDEDTLKVEIYRVIGQGSGADISLIEQSGMVEKSLEYAWLEARRFKYGKLGSGHLLAGITTMDNCTSSYILKSLSIDPEQVRWSILNLLKKYQDNPEPNIDAEQIDEELNSGQMHDEIYQEPNVEFDLTEEIY